MCRKNGIDALTERSRSGRGAHVWIFFKQAISAKLARTFGFLLLDKGSSSVNLKTFQYYDRMYPAQDVSSSIGNLIALPLQGRALREGNSAFVDEDWNAFPDQWEKLFSTQKLTEEQVKQFVVQWNTELTGQNILADMAVMKERPKPWRRNARFHREDVTGILHITLADGIYVDALNLNPRIQNQIRCMAAFDNPVFYKNKRIGRSNYYNSSTIYLGKDVDGYIQIPRGLLEILIGKCRECGITYEVSNQREIGKPIRVAFKGELRMQQELAAQKILQDEDGILSAATAFGKTVVCSYLIAERKVNTLVLLESTDLIGQWVDELEKFLDLDETPPKYKTKTGRVKQRDSVIGTLKGGQDKTTGIIDIAMIGSVFKKGKFFDGMQSYGMVIMDECHHAASDQAQQVLRHVNAKYLYGVSATPMRSDKLEKINYLLLGPIRHRYTAKDRNEDQGMDCIVVPRFTHTVNLGGEISNSMQGYILLSEDLSRNEMISDDVRDCVKAGRTPVILTKLKKHAKDLFGRLRNAADHAFLYYGDNTDRENEDIREQIKQIPDTESVILVATGQKIGEGFDYPRLDTLMLAAPVGYGGRLEQYVGRLSRSYPGKTDMIVYDYVDLHIHMFDNQYNKRLATYKKIGFRVQENEPGNKQEAKAIFDVDNYRATFEQDLVEADHEIIIASPDLRWKKVKRLIDIVKTRQEKGVQVIVITRDPEQAEFEDSSTIENLQYELRKSGIEVQNTGDDDCCYAVIDRNLVWYGGINLLGKADAWDHLIRVKNIQAAAELLEMSCELADLNPDTGSAKPSREIQKNRMTIALAGDT